MRRVESAACYVNVIAAAAVVVGVFVQIYLIASYIFGDSGALSTHETNGDIVVVFELVAFLSALVGWRRADRTQVWLSVALFLVGGSAGVACQGRRQLAWGARPSWRVRARRGAARVGRSSPGRGRCCSRAASVATVGRRAGPAAGVAASSDLAAVRLAARGCGLRRLGDRPHRLPGRRRRRRLLRRRRRAPAAPGRFPTAISSIRG